MALLIIDIDSMICLVTNCEH